MVVRGEIGGSGKIHLPRIEVGPRTQSGGQILPVIWDLVIFEPSLLDLRSDGRLVGRDLRGGFESGSGAELFDGRKRDVAGPGVQHRLAAGNE